MLVLISYTAQNEAGTVHCEASEDSYRAVTENMPKNFTAELQDPVWGAPTQTEFDTIIVDTKAGRDQSWHSKISFREW